MHSEQEVPVEWSSDGLEKSKNTVSTKNKCPFCAAFFINEISLAEHSDKCLARLSAFLATDGRIKFACMVCHNVFDAPSELSEHEQLHKYPGGFGCTICTETFLSETDCVRHTEDVHKVFKCLRCENDKLIPTEKSYIEHCGREHNAESGYAVCMECGASFEEKSHLRFHSETECGQFRGWTCFQCGAIFATSSTLTEHIGRHQLNGLKCESECDYIRPIEFASTECRANLYESKAKEQFHDPMEIDRGQSFDDEQILECITLNAIKVEAIDPNDDFREAGDGEGQLADDTETSYMSPMGCNASDDSKSETVNRDKSSVMDSDPNERQCIPCSLSFSTLKELKAHRKQHGSMTTCYICDKSFENFQKLNGHLMIHKRNFAKAFQCKYCDQKFNMKSRMIAHMSKHTGVKPFQCLACEERFATLTKLQSHRKSNRDTCWLVRVKSIYLMNKESQEPKLCSQAYNPNDAISTDEESKINRTKAKLQVRKWDRLNDLEYICGICEQKYAQKKGFEKHVALHGPDGKRVYKCNCCPKYFVTTDERDEHKNQVHLAEMTCPHCKKVCKNRDALKSHIVYTHQEKKKEKAKHICSKCGAIFPKKSFLENHESSDCGRNPIYKCDQCGKCLGNQYTYRAHLKLHHDDSKTFICTYCGKAWRSKSQLETHVRYHTGEKPYACSYCDKRFFDPTSKRTHESTHTGIKPYMCQCGDRFSCISNLQSHRRARKTTCGLLPLISKAFPQMIAEKLDSVIT